MGKGVLKRLCVAVLATASSMTCSAVDLGKKLDEAGANTWVLLSDEKSGGRAWPMFVYHPGLNRYLLSAGGGDGYDQQVFDPHTCTWSNFYPHGKTHLPATVKMGPVGPGKTVDGVFRIRRSGNAFRPTDAFTYYQWALSGMDGGLYAYFQNTTMRFDPRTGLWKVMKVPAFSGVFKGGFNSNLTMGSLAWDPVNREIVSCGGNSDNDGGSPGTWTLKPGADQWERVAAGSEPLRALRELARGLETGTHALVNAWRNRFHVTETEAEAAADLDRQAAALVKEFEGLTAKLEGARLSGFEQAIPKHAREALLTVLTELKAAVGKTDDRERLLALQKVRDRVEIAARTLDAEPCGRGLSQMATDLKRGKLVLFGGCRLDSYLSDTWVYHCKERKWEQRRPGVSPAPRAGHVLRWLPKSGKIALLGSTTYDSHYAPPRQLKDTPKDLWVYDIDANRWKRLAQSGKTPSSGTGAVGPDDELVFLPRHSGKGRGGRQTWALRVDVEAPDAGSDKAGVAPGTVTYIFRGPDAFDTKSKIEPDKIDTFLKSLPPNQWTPMPKQGPDCNGHEWCASAYDARRHQILFYGGGHSRWHYNDVSHYSLRTATWSTGYRDEYPFGPSAFKSPVNQSFNNRPFFGSHIWDAIAYDPVADRAVMCTRGGLAWAYDPVVREWDAPPRVSGGYGLKVSMCETPHGALQWHAGKLLLFDSKTGTWRRLPVTGARLGGAYGDRTGICYDSKRDCLWLSGDGSPMYRYDFEGGNLTRLPCPRPQNVFVRETAYVPDLDMVMSISRGKAMAGGVGNLAYDICAGKWVLAGLTHADGKTHVSERRHVSDGLLYDPLYRVLLIHRNNYQVLVARPEKKGLIFFDAPITKPKKK